MTTVAKGQPTLIDCTPVLRANPSVQIASFHNAKSKTAHISMHKFLDQIYQGIFSRISSGLYESVAISLTLIQVGLSG